MGRHHHITRAADVDRARWPGGVRAGSHPCTHKRRPRACQSARCKDGPPSQVDEFFRFAWIRTVSAIRRLTCAAENGRPVAVICPPSATSTDVASNVRPGPTATLPAPPEQDCRAYSPSRPRPATGLLRARSRATPGFFTVASFPVARMSSPSARTSPTSRRPCRSGPRPTPSSASRRA